MFYIHILFEDGNCVLEQFDKLNFITDNKDNKARIEINGRNLYGYNENEVDHMLKFCYIYRPLEEAKKDYNAILSDTRLCIRNPNEFYLEVDLFHHVVNFRSLKDLN